MNLLVTLNRANIPILQVMLFSLLENNPDDCFDLYLLHHELRAQDLSELTGIPGRDRLRLHPFRVADEMLAGAQISSRYPREIYYRLFAPRILPDSVGRVLYLDPDTIIRKPLRPLYDTDLGSRWFAGASHVGTFLQIFNDIRLKTFDGTYINSGVLLMDLDAMREQQDLSQVFQFIREHSGKMILPDQDVMNALYPDRILPVDALLYNMTDRILAFCSDNQDGGGIDLEWVRKNTVIIHYCGRNKPWKKNYIGQLGVFYQQYRAELEQFRQSRPDGWTQ